MRFGVIYKVSIGDNFIIGSSLNPKHREKQYLSDLKLKRWGNLYVQNSYNKYGVEGFQFQILQDNIPQSILKDVENIWIGGLCARAEDNKNGMNMQDADAKRPDKKSNIKKSESQKGKKLSEEHKKKISKKVYQYDLDGNFIKEYNKILVAAIENSISEAQIRNNLKNKNKKAGNFLWSFEKLDKMIPYKSTKGDVNKRKVIQINKNGKILNHFDSLKETKKLGFNPSLVQAVCVNRRNTHSGFKWEYLGDKINKK